MEVALPPRRMPLRSGGLGGEWSASLLGIAGAVAETPGRDLKSKLSQSIDPPQRVAAALRSR